MTNLKLIEEDHDYRIFAAVAPANECYVAKLVLIAMPGSTDDCPKVVGHLTVNVHAYPGLGPEQPIEWIEVNPDDRRKGLGTRLWNAAENVLRRKLAHSPVTDDGEVFADSFSPSAPGTTGGTR